MRHLARQKGRMTTLCPEKLRGAQSQAPVPMPANSSDSPQPSLGLAPVAIGGVGGSGTRLIASILASCGFDIGSDRNPANDNLAFTLLFKQSDLWPLEKNRARISELIRLFLHTMFHRRALTERDKQLIRRLAEQPRLNAPVEWLSQRAEALINLPGDGEAPAHWGWKEPNTHIFLPALNEHIPNLKYIHVTRHGLDMAYSANQAQVKLWGEALTGQTTANPTPQASFDYWCAAHRRVIGIGSRMGSRFLPLNFDRFCEHPHKGMARLLHFLGVEPSLEQKQNLLDMVRRPGSVGRHKGEPKLRLHEQDLALLRQLGFEGPD